MITIDFYDHPSEQAELIQAEAKPNQTVREIIGADYSVSVLADGRVVPSHLHDSVRFKDGTHLEIRRIADAAIASAIVAIAAGATASAATTWVGIAASVAISVVGGIATNLLFAPKTPSQNGGQSFQSLNQLTGTQNQIASYQPIPRLFGRRRFYPVIPMTAKPYTETAGDDQYLRQFFVLSHGKMNIGGQIVGKGHDKITEQTTLSDIDGQRPILIGETDIAEYDEAQFEIGTADQMTLYTDQIIEDQPDWKTTSDVGKLNGGKYGIVADGDSTVRTTEDDAEEITIDLTGQLYCVNKHGDFTRCLVNYLVEWRLNGSSGDWQSKTFSIQGDGKTARQSCRIPDLPKGKYDVRLTRVSTNYHNVDGKPSTAVTWSALRTIRKRKVFDVDDVVVMSMRIKATDQLNGRVSKLSVQGTSVLPVYDAANSEWTEQTTRNPAWAFAEIMTGNANRKPIDKTSLDLNALVKWANDNEPDNFNLNYDVLFDDSRTTLDRLSHVTDAGRATYSVNSDTTIRIIPDVPADPVMLVTPRLYSEYSYSLSAYNPPEGLKVRFTNSDTWEDDEIIVYDDGESVDTAEIFASVDAPGCISSDQAYNFGRYHLANQRLRGIESHSFAIDFDHLHFDRGDTIDFQSQQILVGLATGRVLDVATNDTGDITGFTADEFLPMDVATYGCRFDTSDGQRFVAQVDTNSPGSYDLTFTTPIDTTVNDIAPGDLFAFGETGKITTPLKVTQIDRKSEQKAAITCEPAAPNILDALEGDIPVFEPKITQPSDPGNYPPATPKITDVISDASVSVENDDGSLTWRVAVNVQAMSGPVHTAYIEVQAKTADQSKYATARAQDGVAYFTGFNPGDVLTIRIRSVSENGRVSIWVYQYDYTVTGRLPQKPTDVDVQIGTFANTLTPQGGQPATVYEFYRSGVQLDASNIEAQAAFIGQGSSLTDGDLTPETEYFYYVRAVNKYGYSDWYTRSVTTKNSPSAVLKNLSNSISQSDLQNSLLEPIHLITADADTDGSVSQRISETLSTKADADTVSSLWTVRLQGQTADGKNIYSGFGLGLNGDTSSAIFNVDDFAIGSPDANATYAFIEKDGKVIINEALIGTVTFNKLVDGSGNFLVNNNGELKASYIETSGITIGSLSGTADWQTQVAGAGKPTDNADVTKDNAAKSISITDTRNDNQPPSWYRTNYGVQVVSEFKYATSIGLTSAQVGSQYCTLITHAQWSDSSGGPLTQAVHCDNGIFVRQSVNETTWGSWNKADQTSQNTSANTAAVGSLNVSDIESASFNGFFNGFEGSTFNNWAVASGNTITASTDSFSGAQAGLFTSTSTSPTPFTTGAASIYIPAQIALRFAGQPILIQVYAKQPSASASTEFAVAYSTEEVGNSGWHRFTPTTSYAPYSFVYDVPMPNGGGVDSISIWADTSGAGNGVIIDEVAVSLLTGSAYIDALQTANAPAQAGADVTGSNTANDVKTGVGKAVAEAGADKTYNNVAKSVIGQKALATQDNVAWGSQVTGKPLTFRVVARGNSATSQPVEAGLYDAAGTLISGSSRSYRVDVLDRATRAWDSHTIYDVYGNASNATTMANDLNALGSGKIVVIRTYDEPQDHRLTNGLPAAIYRCGGSRSIFGSSNFRYRSAYICVGIPGIGEGNGIELYAGDVDSDPNAWVETAFTIDASGAIQLGRTMVKDAVDISYADGTTVENLKPSQANADKTSSNTSADTANVNGTPAATVASNAATAKQMTSAWASANNTTLINGGKIATDTVYVDTIVVAGDAITVPLFSYSNTTYSNGSGFPSGVYTDIFRADYVANAFGNYNGVLDNTSPLVVTCLLLYSIFDAHNAVSIDLTIKKISDKYPNGTVIFQQTVVDNNGSGSLSIPLFVNIEDPAGLGIQISAMPKGNAYRITYASISFQHFKR